VVLTTQLFTLEWPLDATGDWRVCIGRRRQPGKDPFADPLVVRCCRAGCGLEYCQGQNVFWVWLSPGQPEDENMDLKMAEEALSEFLEQAKTATTMLCDWWTPNEQKHLWNSRQNFYISDKTAKYPDWNAETISSDCVNLFNPKRFTEEHRIAHLWTKDTVQ
jgi:hypothetical protein